MDRRALAIAQALFDRTCERAKARGHEPHHKPGTRVETMPPSYLDDYMADAHAAIRAYEQSQYREMSEAFGDPRQRVQI